MISKSIYKYQLNWHHLYLANQDHTVTITLPSLTFLLCFYSSVIPDVKTCCPLFQRFLEVLPFQGLCHIGLFSKGWSILCTSLPFFKGLLLPKFLSKLFFAIALFSRGLLWMFPSWHPLFHMYLRAGSMRCEGSSYINFAFLAYLLT